MSQTALRPLPSVLSAAITADRRRRRVRGEPGAAALTGPVLAIVCVLALLVAPVLVVHHGDPTAVAWFGSDFASTIHPPAGAVIRAGAGYDGQYFYALGRDPLLLHQSTVAVFAHQGFRLQRMAYPLLAWLVSGAGRTALPWALLGLNLFAVIGLVIGFGRFCLEQGRSAWWGLAAGLLPGVLFAALADLGDVLSTCALLAALVAHARGRRWAVAGWLTLGVLTREPMMLVVAAFGVSALVTRRRGTHTRPALWPAVLVPAAAFAVWQTYIVMRHGGSVTAPGTAYQAPFAAIGTELQRALHQTSVLSAGWELGYLVLMLVAAAYALVLVIRQGPDVAPLAGVLYAASLCVLTFGGPLSYARQSAPLLACLLFTGVTARARAALGLCAAAAVLGLVVPLGIW